MQPTPTRSTSRASKHSNNTSHTSICRVLTLLFSTRFEQDETNLLYFFIDESDELHFALTNDKPKNADGGTMRLKIDSPDLVDQGVYLSLLDDPGATSGCATATSDCHEYHDE